MMKKQRRHHEPVVDHLQHRALGALVAQREDPERDEAELRDRRVPDDQRAEVCVNAITEP